MIERVERDEASLFQADDWPSGGWSVVRLHDPADRAAVTALSAACADYAMLVTGQPPTKADGAQFLTDAPPGHDPESMLKLGILDAAWRLIGVIDVVCGYPEATIWYVGLLLIEPASRHGGIGTAVMAGLADHARAHGATSLRLGVVEANQAASAFWQAIGFAEFRRVPARQIGVLTHTIIELTRPM